jgi:hypothetical protein
MSLPLNVTVGDVVFASAPAFAFFKKKKGYHTFHWFPKVLALRTHLSSVL